MLSVSECRISTQRKQGEKVGERFLQFWCLCSLLCTIAVVMWLLNTRPFQEIGYHIQTLQRLLLLYLYAFRFKSTQRLIYETFKY